MLIALIGYFVTRPKPSSSDAVSSSSDKSSTASPTSAARSSDASPSTPAPSTSAIPTDVSATTFPISAYKPAPAPSDKPSTNVVGSAFIHVPSANQRLIYEPNQIGEYPTVETKLNDTVGVRLTLDDVKPGTPVRVAIMDGGTFPHKEGVSQVLRAAEWGGVAFEFITSGNIGYHRMIVQAQGQANRILNFSAHDPQTWPSPTASTTALTK